MDEKINFLPDSDAEEITERFLVAQLENK